MAFDYTNLYPDTSSNGGYTKSWNYTTLDPVATVSASGYFNKVATRLGIGDTIVVAVVDAFDTKSRTAVVGATNLIVSTIAAGVVTTSVFKPGLENVPNVDATNANNITSGALALARFYNATASRKILARQSAGAGVFEETTASSFLGTLYAEDYGVSASNPAATNDTAFSSLITAIGTGGKRVIFPSGKIQFSTALNLSSLTNVVFEGQGGLDLTYSGNFGTVLHFTGTGSGNIITMTGHRGVWWRDIQVVYSSNSFTGTVFNCSTTFTTGCASGFERVQVYQITNNGHTAGQCFYLKNNVDVTFSNVYVSHASYGWIGLFDSDATSPTNETNMIKLVNCTSIGLGSAAIVNPIIGWGCYGCNFELANSGAPAGFLATGAHTVTNLGLYGCVFADSTGAGTWINLPVNIFNFTMIGGAILTASVPSGTGMILGNTVCSGLVINGVLFSGLSIGISLSATGTIASIIGNEFLNTTTALSGTANLDATSIVIANNGLSPQPIAVTAGGTGLTSYAIGDIVYANGATTLAKLADVATGNALISGGVGIAPSWGKIGINTLANPAIIYTISASGVNMNAVADTQFTITLPTGYTRYRLQALMIAHASASLAGVSYGLFTSTGGGGTAVVSATASAINTASETTSVNAQFLGPSITASLNNATLQFRVTVALGSPATADVYLQIQPML